MPDVRIYVYELTKGLAKSFSSTFLGTNIDGVWHTSIIYDNKEYFYGKGGIQITSPGSVIGPPDEIIDIGDTEIDPTLFQQYIDSLSTANFSGDEYNLFHHNCNTFTNEVSEFLTGKTVPAYILDLPQQVLTSPFGPVLQSYIENLESSFDPLANPSYPNTFQTADPFSLISPFSNTPPITTTTTSTNTTTSNNHNQTSQGGSSTDHKSHNQSKNTK